MNKLTRLTLLAAEEAHAVINAFTHIVKELYNNSTIEYRCEHCTLYNGECTAEYKLPEQCQLGMKDFIFKETGIIDNEPVSEIETTMKQLERSGKLEFAATYLQRDEDESK